VICLTTRCQGEPFVAVVGGQRIESEIAEVVWFTYFDPTNPLHDRNNNGVRDYNTDPPEPVTLYRKVFPIRPDVAGVRPDYPGRPGFRLDELTLRQNRVARNTADGTQPTTAQFPYPLLPNRLTSTIATGARLGEDVVLANVISFDVRVYDPLVPEQDGGANSPLSPGERGYGAANVRRQGTFVNIGHAIPAGHFSGAPHTLSRLTQRAWDTWPFYYEQDGIDQGGLSTVPDEGTNGFDDQNSQPGVDDPSERETSPPYPHPLRGVQIRIRVIDPDTKIKQVTLQDGSGVTVGLAETSRQATVVVDFVPG
jgi:hypothetical protein